MTTFQREIVQPLNGIRAVLEQEEEELSKFDLAKLAVDLKAVREKLDGFVQRAERSDTPYGETMRTKIRELVESAEEMSELLNARLESACEADNQDADHEEGVEVASKGDDAYVAKDVTGAGEPTTAASSAEKEANPSSNADKNAATPSAKNVESSKSEQEKIAEAARKIREREKKLQDEEKKRQQIAAAEERGKRDELRQRERAARAHASKLLLQMVEERQRLITFGTVNHVQGEGDLNAKMRVLNGRACVIDWFAHWCGPCRMMAPVFQQMAAAFPTVAFFSVDTELPANQPLAASRGIRALPTFHINVGGNVETIQGADQNRLWASIQRAASATEAAVQNELKQLEEAAEDEARSTASRNLNQRHVEPISDDAIISLPIALSKGNQAGTMDVAAGTKVRDFREQLRARFFPKGSEKRFLIAANNLILGEARDSMTLGQLGLRSGSVVRLVPMASKAVVKLKFIEVARDLTVDLSTTRLRDLRREARVLTQTMKPRLVFLGRVLEEASDSSTLLQVGIKEDTTILCAPGGEEYKEGAETPPPQAPSRTSKDSEDDSFYDTEQRPGSNIRLVFTVSGKVWLRAEELFAQGVASNDDSTQSAQEVREAAMQAQ